MPLIGILITLVSLYSPFAIDSTIYAVDINKTAIREQTVHGTIIDYCIDDFLYVLTKRYLYKLNPDDLFIVDRTLLPQTYTSMCTNKTKVLLIAAGEIVILAKSHLAYETGIGMVYSDIRPLVSAQGRTIAPDETSLYVVEDQGSNSILKILDLTSGSVKKALRIPRVTWYTYDAKTSTFTTLDAQDRITTYDLNLKKIAMTKAPFTIERFQSQATGFWIRTYSGIYLITDKGTIVDFQPVINSIERSFDDFIIVTEQEIVHLDSLTLRAYCVVPNIVGITRLFHVDHPLFVIGMDKDHCFHFIQTGTLNIQPRIQHESITMEIIPRTTPVKHDSLWYLQLGAFSSIENALQMHEAYRSQTLPVFIDSTNIYRVKLGGFSDKQMGVFIADALHLNGWLSLQGKTAIDEYVEFFVGHEKFILADGTITRSE
jgi:hypothetical protein